MKTLLLPILALALTGCATTPAVPLSEMPATDAALAYWKPFDVKPVNESKRGLVIARLSELGVAESELKLAGTRKIFRGMSIPGLYLSMGRPSRQSRSVGSWGTHIQHVFKLPGRSAIYVYTENGVVTSWQT